MFVHNMYAVNRGSKKVYRFDYYGDDNKKKSIQAPSKKLLQEKIDKLLIGRKFVKTKSVEVIIDEAQFDFVNKKLANKRAAGKTGQGTIDSYESYFENHIGPFFKDRDIRTITKYDVSKFVDHLQEKNDINSQTLIKIFNHFKNIIAYQVDRFKIENNVFAENINYLTDIHVPEKEHKTIDLEVWTFEIMQKIVARVDRPMIRLMMMILLETAARPSEIRALERKHLLFLKSNKLKIAIEGAVKKGKILGKTKTKGGRRQVEISPSLKDHIVDYLNTLPNLQDRLFLNGVGKYVCVERIIKGLEGALKKMEPEYQTLPIDRKTYAFRHFRATHWAAKGKFKNALELAFALGDKDINFVNRTYIAPFEQDESTGEFKENIAWDLEKLQK